MKVFSVCGLHHSGKTTVCEEMMKVMKLSGFSVSSIKDIHQDNFSMDREGSNSWRHLQANRESVIARSLNETCMIWNRQLNLKDMLDHMHTDWVVVEGMKSAPLPRILCANSLEQLEEQFDDLVFAISGPVSEEISEYRGIPAINAINNGNQLFELIREKVFEVLPFHKDGFCGHCGLNCFELTAQILKGKKSRTDCAVKSPENFSVYFNHEEVMMNSFVKDLLNDILSGVCRNLKGYKKGDQVEISFKENNEQKS
ncbi:MAG TPA: molybdopterin-guanine dinucleotide biosynthesis protein MobB [Candidatus Cloacimonadota bacterium]|nr:molybdopterin-guanine dinucleotide biosynthesis protein MobB [Candidatus Cloacimonadota bacterium]